MNTGHFRTGLYRLFFFVRLWLHPCRCRTMHRWPSPVLFLFDWPHPWPIPVTRTLRNACPCPSLAPFLSVHCSRLFVRYRPAPRSFLSLVALRPSQKLSAKTPAWNEIPRDNQRFKMGRAKEYWHSNEEVNNERRSGVTLSDTNGCLCPPCSLIKPTKPDEGQGAN